MVKSMSFDKTYSDLYDFIYSDKNYAAESKYIAELLLQYGVPIGAKVLEVGTGTGKHSEHLQASTYQFQILGIEPSKYMVAKAQARGVKCIQSNVQQALPKIASESFDACIALFHVVSYLTSLSDLKKVFSEISRVLKPNGIFIFDVWHKPAVLEQGMERRVKELSTPEGLEIFRIARPKINVQDSLASVQYDTFYQLLPNGPFHKVVENHLLRFFTIDEIETQIIDSGLEMVHSCEFLTGDRPSINTWSVTHILRKVL